MLSAWARDAKGAQIPSHFEIQDASLVQVIEHTAVAGIAYPVVADPNWVSLLTGAGFSAATKGLTILFPEYALPIKASIACVADGVAKTMEKGRLQAFYFACVKGMAASLIESSITLLIEAPSNPMGDIVASCFKGAWVDWTKFDTSTFGCFAGMAGAVSKFLAKTAAAGLSPSAKPGSIEKMTIDGLGKAAGESAKAAFISGKPLLDAGLDAAASWYGTATSKVICGMLDNGCRRYGTGGVLYSSDRTFGVRAVSTAVMDLWGKWRWETGPLGWPISDPMSTGSAKKNQYVQTFEHGVIVVTDNVAEIAYASDPGVAAWSKNRWLGDPRPPMRPTASSSEMVASPRSRGECLLVAHVERPTRRSERDPQ